MDANEEEKLKVKLLDESFKKAEKTLEVKSQSKKPVKKSYKITFPRLGILLILLGMMGIVVSFTVPWAYINYETGEETIETSIYKGYRVENDKNQVADTLFNSPFPVGVSDHDFISAPIITGYGFFVFILLGLAISIFGFLHRTKNFTVKTFTLTHFIFATLAIPPSVFIITSVIKFLGGHLLYLYNSHILNTMNVPSKMVMIFPAVFILVALGFILLKVAFTIMKIDFKELIKMKNMGSSEQSLSYYAYGR
jgi:hypothetical protein